MREYLTEGYVSVFIVKHLNLHFPFGKNEAISSGY
jgi:hypothetical protein